MMDIGELLVFHFLVTAIQNAVTRGIWIIHEYRVDWITIAVNSHTVDFAVTKIGMDFIADLEHLSLRLWQ